MHKTIVTVAAALAAFVTLAAPAGAATPFTAGQGTGAKIVADPDGNGHVVWGIPSRDGQPAKIGYCRIPAGGNACDKTNEFPFPSAGGQVAQSDLLDVTVHAPRQLEVLIFGSCTACGDGSPADHVFVWQSTTSGATWQAAPFAGLDGFLGTSTTAGGISPGGLWVMSGNTFVSPGEGNKALIFAAQGVAANKIDTVGPFHIHNPSIVSVPVAGGAVPQLVYAADDLNSIQYSVYEGSLADGFSISDPAKWSSQPKSLSVPVAGVGEAGLSSGPTSTLLTYRRSVPGDNQILQRRFNSASTSKSFGPSIALQGNDAIDDSADAPDAAQDQSGRVHVIWSTQHDGGRLRYILSDVAGAAFSAPVSVARGETFSNPDIAAAPSGAGWVAWSTGGDNAIRVVKLEAISDATIVPPPPTTCTPPATGTPPNCKAPTTPNTKPVTKTVSVAGASITFGVPRACVKRGATFKATLTWKKKKRKGNLFVKVAKADFYIGTKIVKTDKTAPFTQTLTVKATAAAGAKMTVRARAHIKVKRGKSPKKSIVSSIKVCA